MSIDEVKAAIAALGDADVGRGAQDMLMQFEASREAWTVAAQLLYDSSPQVNQHHFRFFGAKMLYSKIQRDFDQLADSDISAFMQSLIGHIINLSQEPNIEMKVCRYVCLSIAALAIQINQSGVIRAVLQWLNPVLTGAPTVILEFLALLPEECINQRVDVSRETRETFAHQLTESFHEVLTFLGTQWNAPNTNEDNKRKILDCIEKWVEFTHISVRTLAAQPLYGLCLDCFTIPALSVAATGVVSTAFSKFKDDKELPDLLMMTMPRLLPLRAAWNQLLANEAVEYDSDLQEICHSISKLFSMACEAALPVLLDYGTGDFGQKECILQLLECCRYPHDIATSKFPLTFFYMLSSRLDEMQGDHANPEAAAHATHLFNMYSPFFHTLLNIALEQCCSSEDYFIMMDSVEVGSYLGLSDDEHETREVWQESIIDCRAVLGVMACMNDVCSSLGAKLHEISTQAYSDQKWAPVEARLFVLKFLVVRVNSAENQMMPWLVDTILKFPDLYGLKATFIELTGCCAQWLAVNPTTIQHFLSELCKSLQEKDFTLQSAIAIANIFQKCQRIPETLKGLPIVDMNNLIIQMRQLQTLTLAADNAILEGFCSIISSLPSSAVEDSLRVVAGGLLDDLNNHLVAEKRSDVKKFDAGAFAGTIDRLTTVLKSLNIETQFYAALFGQVYVLLQEVLLISAKNAYVSEKVCRCYKYVMKTMKKEFEPFLPSMTEHLAHEYSRNSLAAFLYGGSICVAEFARINDPTINNLLLRMLQSMTASFFKELTSLEKFEEKPDLVEEFYFLMAKATQFAPTVFLQSQQEQMTIYSGAIVGLQVKHRDAHRGILTFLEKFVGNVDYQHKELDPVRRHLSDVYLQVSLNFGGSLISALLICLSGELTMHSLGGSRNVCRLFLEMRNVSHASSVSNAPGANNVFYEWVNTAIYTLPLEAQKIAIDMKLQELSHAPEDVVYRNLDKFFLRAQCVKV